MGMGMVTRAAKYAVYLAICCFFYKMCERCIGKMCKKRDPWNIQEEVQGAELAAGHVFKPDGMLGFWGEFYLTLRDGRLILWADQTRTGIRGEFVLAGATAERSATRADEDDKLYFTVTHPDQGVREFYVISEQRREQWLTIINATAGTLRNADKVLFGMLFKIGGLTKTTWEDRWCVCAGPNLVYYVNKTDDYPGGILHLPGASVRDVQHLGKKYAIEIIQDKSSPLSRKKNKKYLFATESQGQQMQWLAVLRRNTADEVQEAGGVGAVVANPLLAAAGGGVQMSGTGGGAAEGEVGSQRPTSKMRGPLEKKQKSVFGGWQKRYFVLEPGERGAVKLLYFETQEKADSNGSMKGFVDLSDILPDNKPKRLDATELTFTCKGKLYTLRAPTPQDRDEWVLEMNKWRDYAVSLKETRRSLAAAPPQ